MSFTGYEWAKSEVPEHLEGLRAAFQDGSCYIGDIDEEEYARIAFQLLKISTGGKDSLKEVAEYIQKQHQALKQAKEQHIVFAKAVSSWLYWAKNWTVRKPS